MLVVVNGKRRYRNERIMRTLPIHTSMYKMRKIKSEPNKKKAEIDPIDTGYLCIIIIRGVDTARLVSTFASRDIRKLFTVEGNDP